MGDDKKHVDEKRYAILSRDSIKTFAESVGHSDISDEVAALLAEDVVYRVREATMNACQFTRHGKRRKLTTEDFNKGLKNSDVQPLLGYTHPSKLPFRHTREGDLFFIEDTEVDLATAALKPHPVNQPGTTSVNAQWLAVEGIQKGAVLGSAIAIKTASNVVSEDLLAYYDNMTKAILGHDEQVTKAAFTDLRKNSKIAPLLPYFVNFVNNGVKTVSHDISQLIKLLHTVNALVRNKALYLEPKPFLDLLVQTVLYCLLEPLAASINPVNDHWAVRDYAARLLAVMTREWTSTANQLRHHNMAALKEVLYDLGRPFCSHYGAVMGLIAFGTKAVERVLVPHLAQYWIHLQAVLDDPTATSGDHRKVYGAILLAMERVVNERGLQLLNPSPQPLDELDDPNDSLAGLVDFGMYTVESSAVSTAVPITKPDSTGPSATASNSSMAGSVVLPVEASTDTETSIPHKSAGIHHFPRRDLLGPVIELPDNKESSVLTPAIEQDSELLGTVLNLPEAGKEVAVEKLPLAVMYAQLSEYFGDSLAARLPVRRVDDVYMRLHPNPVVSLSDPDSRKSGEELLQVFLNVSGGRLDESENNTDIKSENYDAAPNEMEADEQDEKSERSSEHSDDSTYMEDSNLTVKTVVGTGIKLTFRMLPKIEPPAPPPPLPPPPPPPPPPLPPPVVKVTRKYSYDEVFEKEPYEPPHLQTTFVFSYAGCVQETRPKPRTERTIFDDSHLQWSGQLLEINTKLYGRRKGCTPMEASRRRHDHTCTLYNML